MNAPNALPGHDGWHADVALVLGAHRANPDLPRPATGHDYVDFLLTATIGHNKARAPRILAETERILSGALDVTFTAGEHLEDGRWLVLEALLPGGTKVRIRAWAPAVAEKRVTGTRTVEETAWVRLPVPELEAVA